MGWSCNAAAAFAMDAISERCDKGSNAWTRDGEQFFFETSRTEHDDGAITGSIYKMGNGQNGIAEGRCRRVGTFRIDGDGNVKRFPHCPIDKDLASHLADLRYRATYPLIDGASMPNE